MKIVFTAGAIFPVLKSFELEFIYHSKNVSQIELSFVNIKIFRFLRV